MTTEIGHPYQNQAWYQSNGQNLPTVQILKSYFEKAPAQNNTTAQPTIPQPTASIASTTIPQTSVSRPTTTVSPVSTVTSTANQSITAAETTTTVSIAAATNPVSLQTSSASSTPAASVAAKRVPPQAAETASGAAHFYQRPIQHYLLLPAYEWGVADWHLDVIRPFVKKYRPTVGFSIKEAALAKRVTVIGNTQTFPEASLDQLRQVGCLVERISGDGTSVATQLAER